MDLKIQQIKNNYNHLSGNLTKDNTSSSNPVDSRSMLNQASKNSAIISNHHSSDDSSNKNISKLEEVLKRQRDRLENISNAFTKNEQADMGDSSHYSRSTPLGRSEMRQSDGVYSSSTNNLEKAYEDLEREIIEIKQRL